MSGHSIARNSVLALAVQLTTAGFTAVLTLYLVRALGPADFGVFALALAIGGVLVVPSDFGVSAAAARFIAERRGDAGAVAEVVAAALRLKLLFATTVAGVLLLAATPLARLFDEPDLEWPIRGIALALLGQSLMLLFVGSFVAQARVDRNLLLVASESVVELTASVALVAAGAGAAGAAFGRGVGYAVGAAVGLLLTVKLVGRGVVAFRRARTPGLARYAGPLAIVDWAYALFDQLDAILIGLLLGSSAVGLFTAPLRLVAFLFYPGYALANGVAPRLARTGDSPPNVRAFTFALRASILFQAAVTALVVVWAGPLVELLLGDGYEESADVLRAFGPYVFFAGFGVLVSIGANYLGQARRRVPLALAAIAINGVFDVVFIPRIGIVAGAIGTDIAYAVYVLGHLWICVQTLAIPLKPVLVTIARSAVAGAAMSAVLLAVGTADLSLAELLLGAAAAAVAYVAALVLTREVSLAELRAAWRRLRGRR